MPIALTHFAARAGDHNDRAMAASPLLAAALGRRLGVPPVVVGHPEPALASGWHEELDAATPALSAMARRYDQIFDAADTPVAAISRCAVAIATMPVLARHRPDAVVVWFDAHADLNTPENTTSGYLGGLALSAPLGLWQSGLGDGLALGNVVLVGTRDFDDPEQQLVDSGSVAHVPVSAGMHDELRGVIAGRPVYIHIDCDVLDPGVVPTDYLVPEGMSLGQLTDCCAVLAESQIVGIEVGELETGADLDPGPADRLVAAIEPLLSGLEPR